MSEGFRVIIPIKKSFREETRPVVWQRRQDEPLEKTGDRTNLWLSAIDLGALIEKCGLEKQVTVPRCCWNCDEVELKKNNPISYSYAPVNVYL